MKIAKQLFGYLVLATALVLSGCEIEPVASIPSEIDEIAKLTSEFDINIFEITQGIPQGNLNVQWDEHETANIKDNIWHEFEINQKVRAEVGDDLIVVSYSLLGTIDDDEEPIYRIARMVSNNGQEYKGFTRLSEEYFTGTTYLYDNYGQMILTQYYEKGAALHGLVEEGNQQYGLSSLTANCTQKVSSARCESTNDCFPTTPDGCGGSGQGGSYVWGVTGTSYTDWFLDRGGFWEYTHTAERDIYGWTWVPSGGSASAPQNSWQTYGINGNNGSVNSITRPWNPSRSIYDDDSPPSCESFNFVATGSNAQESAVVGIYFNIWLITGQAPFFRYKHTIILEQPVLFSAPLKDRFGLDYRPGAVAEASARALNEAMRDTAREYADTETSTAVVEAYFKQRIRDNMPLYVNGGRANTNSTTSLLPTPYKPTLFGYGDCD